MNPKFIIDVAATWFDRAVDEYCGSPNDWNPLDEYILNNSHIGAQLIAKASHDEPQYFAENLLPRAVNAIRGTEIVLGEEVSNRIWPWLTNSGDPSRVDEAILLSLRRSLQWLAKHRPQEFRSLVKPILQLPHKTFAYLLLRAWTDTPEEFGDECARYLCEQPSRFRVGYSSYSMPSEGTGVAAISRMALRAISSTCSPELFSQIESTVIGSSSEYERKTPKYRGYSELLILRSLETSRLSKAAILRIEELERKFPSIPDAIVPEDDSSLARFIGPPLSDSVLDRMSDQQWISAMAKYNGINNDFFRGGPVELSRRLADYARKDRQRFSLLVQNMPDNLNPIYFDAILNGMTSRFVNLPTDERELDDQDIARTSTSTFLAVIERLDRLPGKPCGTAIVSCLGRLADRQLPSRAFELLHFYATSDPDPKSDTWNQVENQNAFPGDPYSHGINCVRGQAAECLSSLLYEDQDRIAYLRPTLISLVNDPVISVRCCAIKSLLPLLNFSRDEAVDLFVDACSGSPHLFGTRPFEMFLHYAVYTHYTKVREIVQAAIESADEKSIEIAVRQTILADLSEVDVGDDARRIRHGGELVRRTAASVYARNLSDSVVGNKCAEHLKAFFNDDSDVVRKEASGGFYYVNGARLLELKQLVEEFIESQAFIDNPEGLLRSLEESESELPDIVCRAAERILEFIGEEGTSIAHAASSTALSIATLVVRQYEQSDDYGLRTRCLDLIDEMERIGYYGIGEELGKIDR
jgi:hypothetical protein